MLPGDVLGVTVYNVRTETFEFKRGPIFTNFLLADEINRTTPKTQSALLEAMNEGQVSVDGATYRLVEPFMVIATQNPVEHHGTYPLPESQLDRFLLRLRIGYPDVDSERLILRGGDTHSHTPEPVMDAAELLALREEAETVRVDDAVLDYLLAIVEKTRNYDLLSLGVSRAGPRQCTAPCRLCLCWRVVPTRFPKTSSASPCPSSPTACCSTPASALRSGQPIAQRRSSRKS